MSETPDKSNISSRFSASAGTYETHAHVQKTVASYLMTLVSAEPAPSHVLEIGCGTGQMTKLLFRKFPHAQFHVLDVSPEMIEQCRRATSTDVQVNWHVSDIESYETDQQFPLIVSNSVLHWVEPLPEVLEKLKRISTRPAELVCSIMVC